MTIEAVIFDIGNVLIRWQPELFYDAEIGEARRRTLFETVDLHAMNEAVDSGASFKTTVYSTAEKHPEFAKEIRLWHDRWTTSPPRPFYNRCTCCANCGRAA